MGSGHAPAKERSPEIRSGGRGDHSPTEDTHCCSWKENKTLQGEEGKKLTLAPWTLYPKDTVRRLPAREVIIEVADVVGD